ncbi:Ig-like domain-containing protein [Blautia sp. MSJ-19]|uniref:Ig-like domain-containing protein n=1 Tax=Blautia sp. MSJ-19 TaxID=2841517 RepID=UPI001C0ED47F|nr:Ig-like domain-containing protein [Blautia sp. MSJ-19]MBU5482309.1 Ig-like domain-containing protein [Blautia sp. MSJ-19]
MKKLRKILVALMVVLCIGMISPVSLAQVFNVKTVEAAAKINKSKVTLIKGQSLQLKVNGNSKKVKWSSSQKGVATVTGKGKVTAKNAGTAVITAKVGNKKYTCKVTVEAPKLSKTSISLTVGNKYNLKVTGTKQKVVWSSSNKAVVMVLNNGLVVAKKAGTAKITAKVGNKKYTCKVTVKKRKTGGNTQQYVKATPTPAPKIELSASVNSISVKEDESNTVSIKYTGTGSVYYAVDDSNIVDCQWIKGWNNDWIKLNITGKKAGTTTVKITNSTNNDCVRITVNVISAVTIKLPKVPVEVYNYYGNTLMRACNVTNIYYKAYKTGNSYTFYIYVDGTKTYDKYSDVNSTICEVGYKLYKNGIVVTSGSVLSPSVSVGESFAGRNSIGFLNEPGEYELVLTNIK